MVVQSQLLWSDPDILSVEFKFNNLFKNNKIEFKYKLVLSNSLLYLSRTRNRKF